MGRSIAHPWLCQFNKARIFTYEGNEYNATRHLLNYIIKLTFDDSRYCKMNIMKLFAAIASKNNDESGNEDGDRNGDEDRNQNTWKQEPR
jgi:hypothetical protein